MSEVMFASVLGSYGAMLALCLSRQVHGLIVKYGCGLIGVALGCGCGLIVYCVGIYYFVVLFILF